MITSITDDLDRSLSQRNLRGVRASCSSLLSELERGRTDAFERVYASRVALEALPVVWKDAPSLESLLMILALKPVVFPRPGKLRSLVKIALERKLEVKTRALVLKVLGNLMGEEAGVRCVVHAGGVEVWVDTLKQFAGDRQLVLFALTGLATCCLFQMQGKASVCEFVEVVVKIARGYRNDAEIVEQALCVLAIISTGKQGVVALLGLPDAKQAAVDALTTFAMRTYQKSVENAQAVTAAAAVAALNESPLNAIRTGFSRLTAAAASNLPLLNQDVASSFVVTSNERRCTAWALIVLHNLALFAENKLIKKEILVALEQVDASTSSRGLHKRVLERVKGFVSEADKESPNERTTPDLKDITENWIDFISSKQHAPDEFQESDVFAALFNVTYAERFKGGPPMEFHLQAIQLALQEQIAHPPLSSPLPLSLQGSRLLSFVFAAVSHPVVRERLTRDSFELLSVSLANGTLRNRGGAGTIASPATITDDEMLCPEFFTLHAKALESALGNFDPKTQWIPYPNFPAFAATPTMATAASPAIPFAVPASPGVTITSPSTATPMTNSTPSKDRSFTSPDKRTQPNSDDVGSSPLVIPTSTEFNLFEWRANGKEIVKQFTLRMERLFGSLDACTIDDPNDENVKRFLKFHDAAISYFIREILAKSDPGDRALLIEGIIQIASVAATETMSNLDLTMACLQALHCESVARLDMTWRRVKVESIKVLDELTSLSKFFQLEKWNAHTPPPALLRVPSIPYVFGALRVLKQVVIQNVYDRDGLIRRYNCLSWWLPRMGRNGDWHALVHMYPPLPNVQMVISKLVEMDDLERRLAVAALPSLSVSAADFFFEDQPRFLQRSLDLEPDWVLDQARVQETYASQIYVEFILNDSNSPEAQAIEQFRRLEKSNSIGTYGKFVKGLMKQITAKVLKWREVVGVGGGVEGGSTDGSNDSRKTMARARVGRRRHRRKQKELVSLIGGASGSSGDGSNKSTPTKNHALADPENGLNFDVNESLRKSPLHDAHDDFEEDRLDFVAFRICVERVVLAPVNVRLFVKCAEDCFLAESELQASLASLRAMSKGQACDKLDVPEKLRGPAWRGAAVALSAWGAMDLSPTLALDVIMRVKDEMFREASQNGIREMSADDVLPVFSMILLSAQGLRNVCGVCAFLRLFFGDDLETGESAYYLICLESVVLELRRRREEFAGKKLGGVVTTNSKNSMGTISDDDEDVPVALMVPSSSEVKTSDDLIDLADFSNEGVVSKSSIAGVASTSSPASVAITSNPAVVGTSYPLVLGSLMD